MYGGNATGNGHYARHAYNPSTDLASQIDTAFSDVLVKYTSAAGFVVYLYDLLLTFDDEVSFFWNSSGGWLIKFLYLTNRYLPLLALILTLVILNGHMYSKAACEFSLLASIVCQVVGAAVTAAIFSLRVLTIYKSSFDVRAIVIFCFWSSVLVMLALLIIDLVWMGQVINLADEKCVVDSDFSKPAYATVGLYIAPLFCEIVVMAATVRHALDTRRTRQTLKLSRASPVLRRLHNDGFAYFFLVFSLRLFSCLVWLLAPTNYKYFSDYFDYSLTSIATSRFFLALRRSISKSIILTNTVSNSNFTTDGFGDAVHFATPIIDVSCGSSSFGNKSPYAEMPMETIGSKSGDEHVVETVEYQPKDPQPP